MKVAHALFVAVMACPIALLHAHPASSPCGEHASSARSLRIDGEVSDMYVKGDSLEVVFCNTGRFQTSIVGEIQVRLVGDSVVTALPITSASVKSGEQRTMRIAMPKLAKGAYVLFVVVDFGGAQLTAAKAELEIRE